ncbi:hypothetical protein [Novosphingobium decolorationis]|uniref:Uncharacterized protein n=1 Tax=Novosphingobium decolorationis TaxID=2698673 RepID=A0ABX8E220_9SPHN|nr:hypothetical protein [Novosphingobium decolorationis]QVM82958.1 hypothetical protein HT578_03855 [Novosphingobium decolorationis]
MIPVSQFKLAPGCVTRSPDDAGVVANAPAFKERGITYLPTGSCSIADTTSVREDGLELTYITLMLDLGPMGLHHPINPDEARILAAGLIRAAEAVEGKIASKANAAINKAFKSGGAQ